MKKTLLTLAMCAASLMGTASADANPFTVTPTEFDVLVTGSGTYRELIDAPKDYNDDIDYLRLGAKGGEQAHVIISKGDEYTPSVGMLEFANATLEFKDVVTLYPDKSYLPYGPGMLAGYITGYSEQTLGPIIAPGSLTISIAKTKVDEWLNEQKNLDVMASWHLLEDSAQIQPTKDAVVTMQFIDDDGNVVVEQGGVYEYTDKSGQTHEYDNVGVVWAEGELLKKQIALHFVPGGEGEWGGGQLNVLALGENYIPVPEPATGTLSLLALAGLAARRRRK